MSRATCLILWCVCCFGLSLSHAQSADESIRPAIRINVFCSTCDNFVRCQSDDTSYTLYRLRSKTVWGQIATIWDYLIALVRPKILDKRPLTIYGAAGEQKSLLLDRSVAIIDLQAATIRLPEGMIDMQRGEWFSAAGASQGHCAQISNRDGYGFVRDLLGRPLPEGRSP